MKPINRLLIALLIMSIITLAGCNSRSSNVIEVADPQEKPSDVNTNNESTDGEAKLVLVIDEWAPLTGAALPSKGIASEIVMAAMDEANLSYEIQFTPWARALETTKHGTSWGTYPWFYTEERTKDYFYSDVIFEGKTYFFYLKNNPKFPNGIPENATIKDMKSYKFGGVFGYFYEDIFKTGAYSYDLSSDLDGAFKLMNQGKVDLIVEDELVGWDMIRRTFPDNYQDFSASPARVIEVENQKFYLMVTKNQSNTEAYLNKFNEGLRKIRENGTYKRIFEKYGIENRN